MKSRIISAMQTAIIGVVCTLVGLFMAVTAYFNYPNVLRFGLGILFLSSLLIIAYRAIHVVKIWIDKKFYMVKRWLQKFINSIKLATQLVREMHKHSQSNIIELNFRLFVHFYETRYKDMMNWALPIEMFPNGVKDLADMYKYVLKTRLDNNEELSRLYYDFKKQKFEYWGSWYEGLQYKFIYDQLYIIPQIAIEALHPDRVFEHKRIALERELYEKDSYKAYWIIERRRFFEL